MSVSLLDSLVENVDTCTTFRIPVLGAVDEVFPLCDLHISQARTVEAFIFTDQMLTGSIWRAMELDIVSNM